MQRGLSIPTSEGVFQDSNASINAVKKKRDEERLI